MKVSLVLAVVFALCVQGAFIPEASAQIRAAYTKNVNEPGREPYNITVEFSSLSCIFNCSNFAQFSGVLLFNAPPVPAGKRLIVLSVSAQLPSNNAFNSISFQSQRVISNQRAKWQFHGPFYSNESGILWGMSSEAFFTYEPGETPMIRVGLGDSNNYFSSISIGGYLIDANN